MTFTLPLPDAKEGSSNEIFARPANLYALLSEKEPHFDSTTLPEMKRFRCPRLRCLAADYFQNVPSPCPLPKETSPVPEKGIHIVSAPDSQAEADFIPAGFCHLSAIKISAGGISSSFFVPPTLIRTRWKEAFHATGFRSLQTKNSP